MPLPPPPDVVRYHKRVLGLQGGLVLVALRDLVRWESDMEQRWK